MTSTHTKSNHTEMAPAMADVGIKKKKKYTTVARAKTSRSPRDANAAFYCQCQYLHSRLIQKYIKKYISKIKTKYSYFNFFS